MVSAKKLKKGRGAAERKNAKLDKEYEKELAAFDEKAYKEFQKKSSFNVGNKPAKTPRSFNAKRMARVVQYVCTFIFFLAVLSRWDFFTAFGVGTGVSKAHISPMSVTVRASETLPFVQKNYRLKSASKKILRNLAFAGEFIQEATAKESALKKASKKSKKKKKKKTKYELSRWDRADKWLTRTRKDSSLRKIVDGNTFLSVGSAVCLIGAALSIVFPDASIVTFFGVGTMFVGANAQGSPTRPEPFLYASLAVLALGYMAGQYADEHDSKKKRRKRKEKRKKRRARVVDSDDEKED